MTLQLNEDRRSHLISKLRGFFLEEFDETLSEFRAEQILDFALSAIGPPLYNQGVQDARKYMLDKLSDLDGDVYEPEVGP